ncbi:MAG: GNAT family N-acetyltransferase [Deltaproteobacteria bacterium]|nr:GNAT family N-acetyltransferase [Deltaproteobacteria bacterium]
MDEKAHTILQLGGHELVFRQPAVEPDLDRLVSFFRQLSSEQRNYLRYDVTEAGPCRQRLEQLDGKDHWRLVAEQDGEIIGDATMDREPFGWTRHVAELRAVVNPSYLHLGVGPTLFRELAAIGNRAGIELLFTEVMADQTELVAALEKSGFVKEAVRKRYAKDLRGQSHDVIIMSNDLEAVWRRLADLIEETDMRGGMEG